MQELKLHPAPQTGRCAPRVPQRPQLCCCYVALSAMTNDHTSRLARTSGAAAGDGAAASVSKGSLCAAGAAAAGAAGVAAGAEKDDQSSAGAAAAGAGAAPNASQAEAAELCAPADIRTSQKSPGPVSQAHASKTMHAFHRQAKLSHSTPHVSISTTLLPASQSLSYQLPSPAGHSKAFQAGDDAPCASAPAAPAGASGLPPRPPSRSSTAAGAAGAAVRPEPAVECGGGAACGAAGIGSAPSEAAMVGSTLMSDSFLGPRPPSAGAPCAPRPCHISRWRLSNQVCSQHNHVYGASQSLQGSSKVYKKDGDARTRPSPMWTSTPAGDSSKSKRHATAMKMYTR